MKKNLNLFLLPLFMALILFSSCSKEDTVFKAGEPSGSWNVTAWIDDGVAEDDVAMYDITLSFTSNNSGTMTFTTSVVPFNYTGSFSIDANNLLTATLDETTNNMEIDQWILSMDATINANDLTLNGSMLKKSPYWPDATSTVIFEATR